MNSARKAIIRLSTSRISCGLWMRGKLFRNHNGLQEQAVQGGWAGDPWNGLQGCRQMALSWWLSARSQENIDLGMAGHSLQVRSRDSHPALPIVGGSWWTSWCKKIRTILFYYFPMELFASLPITTFTKQIEWLVGFLFGCFFFNFSFPVFLL